MTSIQPASNSHSWQSEHRALQELLHGIEQALEQPLDSTHLKRRILELIHHIARHFWHEEKGGYFEAVASMSPHFRPRIEQLQNEHIEMREKLEELLPHLEQLNNEADWDNIRRAYHAFVAQFEAHEASEEQLLQEAYQTDIGTED